MCKTVSVIFTLFLGVNLGNAIEWTYDKQSNWPGKCKNGRNQSPIALSDKSSKIAELPDFDFQGYETPYPATVVNNGHSVEINLLTNSTDKKPPSIAKGGLNDEYIFNSFHFHWPSEHVIGRFRYPLEAHFVHYAQKYGNLENALNYTDGLAVIAVFYKSSKQVNHAFDELVERLPEIAQTFNSPINTTSEIALGRFLTDQDNLYRYHGSLTTPNCNEAIIWTVFVKPSFISKEQYKVFTNMYAEPDRPLQKNFRYLQHRNNRQVYRTQPVPMNGEVRSGLHVRKLSLIGIGIVSVVVFRL